MPRLIVVISCLSLWLSACSSGTSEPTPAPEKQPPVSSAPQGPAPSGSALSLESGLETASQASDGAPPNLPDSGTVISTLDVPGSKTMYMELENNGKHFWVAAATIEIKAGERVTYDMADAVVMENFTSRALGRTFDEVILVANAKKIAAAE